MKNSQQPAYPCIDTICPDGTRCEPLNTGLTKREYFAAMAMQGLLMNYVVNGQYGSHPDFPMVSSIAVRCADSLLEELEKNDSKRSLR